MRFSAAAERAAADASERSKNRNKLFEMCFSSSHGNLSALASLPCGRRSPLQLQSLEIPPDRLAERTHFSRKCTRNTPARDCAGKSTHFAELLCANAIKVFTVLGAGTNAGERERRNNNEKCVQLSHNTVLRSVHLRCHCLFVCSLLHVCRIARFVPLPRSLRRIFRPMPATVTHSLQSENI